MRWICVIAVLVAATGWSRAAELGSEAPPLRVSSWVKGAPVDLSAGRGTNVFVLEFWATWCRPCWRSIPRLTDLQRRFKDRGVVVVAISDEPAATVTPFVEGQGARLDYGVGIDDAQQTSRAYIQGFGEDGIPVAFVVDRQGRVVWRGHPEEGLEEVVAAVVADRFDLAGVRRRQVAERLVREYFEQARSRDVEKARELGERVLREGAGEARILNNFAWVILTHPRLERRDFELAVRASAAACELTGNGDAAYLDTLARVQYRSGRVPDAVATLRRGVAVATDAALKAELEKTLAEYSAKLR